jgi:predicted Zn-dependent protease
MTAFESPRFLSHDAVNQIVARLRNFARGGGEIGIELNGWWNSELRWARNRVSLASDRRDVDLNVSRRIGAGYSLASTNQLDDRSLEAVVRAAERGALSGNTLRIIHDIELQAPERPIPVTAIWSDATYAVTAEARGALAETFMEQADARGMQSSGYLEVRAGERGVFDPEGPSEHNVEGWPKDVVRYDRYTQAQCSMTVRHPKGIGSGWAGASSYDWSVIDGQTLAARALDKCLASLNPVRIEPGRYTTILEPQAVWDIVKFLDFSRALPEDFAEGPFVRGFDSALHLWRSKLGTKVVDERITLQANPGDPRLGSVPVPDLAPVTLIERGTLINLMYKRSYALAKLNDSRARVGGTGLRMSGGTTSIDEMIATTQRGLLVTRFSNLGQLDRYSVLLTGVTRDGLWLIEKGKISKAVKNMRITESPMFVLNQIEQLGVPVPVFNPNTNPQIPQLMPAIMPPIKANDFSFTSTSDAV